MSLVLNTPPVVEPVTLDQAKAYLKVDTGDDDALITALIPAARARAEWHTGRAFLTQSWTLWCDAWPCDGIVESPVPPLQSIASVTTYANDDTARVLDTALYQVDAESRPGRMALKPGAGVFADLRPINAIAIAFTAGYGDDAAMVPAPIAQAILRIVARLYAGRGDDASALDDVTLALLAPYRILAL